MFSHDQVVKFMVGELGVIVDQNRLGEETVELYQEEIDEEIISSKGLAHLPNPVTVQTFVYDDEFLVEWVIGIAFDVTAKYPLLLFCLKDGVSVYERLLI
ncbi:hypothetical protein [Bacillus sp. Au-Bac7]|uniref:hypothetical protein n=1 Tax=Bacillus sp. Au-Bac7 TaxID=2906458 RepID=UPI001E48EA12|nr:hypothetical protein [Bacillus sp. Au-Bac7]MCE4049920.1 hypothetical protein [Bacillus sp. Au-Bac7]